MDDRLVLLEPQALQHGIELVGPENAHEVVFQREEELGMPGIALAAGTAAQLVVDAPALVALGAEHEEPASGECRFLEPRDLGADLLRPPRVLAVLMADILEFLADAHIGIAAKLDVGAAAGHV